MTIFIVTGNGTGVGKTLASAILTRALLADYWKPIQCGEPTDAARIAHLSPTCKIHPEAFRLRAPRSPHEAANLEGLRIEPFSPPLAHKLIIETAGGPLVPLNDTLLTIDLFSRWPAEWIIVSRHYLGSINHTLLTIEALKQRGCSIKGLIFNGPPRKKSEEALRHFSALPILGRLAHHRLFTPELVHHYAQLWRDQL